MKEYIDSVEKCLGEKNYYAALFIALSIPDICGKLETPRISNGPRAKRWFTENLKDKYFPDFCYDHLMATNPDAANAMHVEQLELLKQQPFNNKFDEKTFWKLRCAFLHEASDWAGGIKIHLTHGVSHMIMYNGALQLSADRLCRDIANAATDWLERVKDDPIILERINNVAAINNVIMGGLVRFD
ncbi:hypothetical protein NNO04_20595 [Citrobacter sp. Awk 4]|uniref:hypothetical protein n=1 Tax=Citrobacter sp. Awk 4 TaxID=2963955 RepID=UPI0023028BE8|nr:hypothetical protein [Citrobacter sp. Awk 4]MDA8481074.1 hypothetical protein [Citrobacter sp. Awk 4]